MSKQKRTKKPTGYIKLNRAIVYHWLWYNARQLQWWLQLLFMAAWEPRQVTFGNVIFNLQTGQIATTTRTLMTLFKCSNRTVFNFLTVLENNNMIVRETSKKMTILTIVNYELYQQDSDAFVVPDVTEKSATSSVKPHHKLHHNKEDKEDKEEKNINNSQSLSRARDLEFIEELKNSDEFFVNCAALLDVDLASLKGYFQQFMDEMLLQEKFHNSSSDYRRHFFNWTKIQINQGPRPKKINLNEQRTKSTTQSSAPGRQTGVSDQRRGTGVSTVFTEPKEGERPF